MRAYRRCDHTARSHLHQGQQLDEIPVGGVLLSEVPRLLCHTMSACLCMLKARVLMMEALVGTKTRSEVNVRL